MMASCRRVRGKVAAPFRSDLWPYERRPCGKPTNRARRKARARRAHLWFRQPLWLRDWRRDQDWIFCRDPKKRQNRRALQDFESHFYCEGVTLEDNVFIGHGVTFINDRYPRATDGNGQLK